MISKLVKEQLEKCQYCDLSDYNEAKNEYTIPKRCDIKLKINNTYLLQLNNECLNSDYYVNINWNNNKAPIYSTYKASIVDIKAKMIKIDGLAYDVDNQTDIPSFWSGWIPLNMITVIEEL